ncbi:serine/threonine-protein kinase [Amycolatopsis sacchari]|uniref:serine/threonine-protein kinase n=1 Tax=Amycolatopsis sacchari TaxID=115433 RepID=UPI003D7465F0
MTSARAGAVGELVAGRYRLLAELGCGAMGSVWRAFDERLQRKVAVKQVVPADHGSADEIRERVLREGRIAARLQHPHAVAVFDVVEDDGTPVLVMEYLQARSLAEVLAERGRLPVPEAAQIGAEIAEALAAAHVAGIVHRDVKPGNVLLSEEGAKLTDFGIADAVGDATITAAGVVAGTPTYLAPETVHGKRPAPGSDVFSLGATLYNAVEGVPPFGRDPENPYAVLFRIAAGELRPPELAGPLSPVLTAMLAPEPADRPTADEAATLLRVIADGQSLPEPAPRRRWLLATVAGGLAAAALLAYLVVDAPPAGTASPAAPPPPVVAPVLTAADRERAVSDYYALLPARAGEAWGRLTAQRRGEGQDGCRQYWAQVASLTVVSPPRADGEAVTVGLELLLADGTRVHEVHRVELQGLLLGADTLVTSERTAPAPPPPPPPSPVPAPPPVVVTEVRAPAVPVGPDVAHGKRLGHAKKP